MTTSTTTTTSVYQAASESPVLVPLDGSALAEHALPVAELMADRLGAPLVLARVVPVTPVPVAASYMPLPPEIYQQLVDDERRLAGEYLQRQAEPLRERGLTVKTVLLEGDAASMLLDICSARQIRLVVMTSHGRTGLTRFALGSVADRLVRYGHVPVLLLRSYGTGSAAPETSTASDGRAGPTHRELGRILVPLDGSALAETALPVVWELAGTVAHDITLLRVVPFTADEQAHNLAYQYLRAHAEELQAQLASRECHVRTAVREGVLPSEKIIDEAEAQGDLIVMATHGWGGMKRWVLGSVADQVFHTAHVPVLLVHTGESAAAPRPAGAREPVARASSGR
jgi:nucleotide-binding universal stress UspA family protein